MGWFSRRRTSNRTDFLWISVGMMVIGVVLAFMSLRSINYKQTEGTIVQSAIVRSSRGATSARIRYTYSVNDVNYENDTVTYGLTNLRDNEALISQYPAGSRVPVYYSITDPSYSVLEKGFSFASLGMSLLGVVLLLAVRAFSR